MKTLHLTLKKKWFDMIASGDKKEEYREIKEYWIKRLAPVFSWDIEKYPIKINENKNVINRFSLKPNEFEYVEFKNGYSKNAPTITLECKGIEIKEGKTEWGAEQGVKYFVIKLGNIK